METDHPPRDKQAHLAKPSLWVAEPAGDPRSPLEDVSSLIEENARLRGLVVKLTEIILRNVAERG